MVNKAKVSSKTDKDRLAEKAAAFKRVVEPRVAKAVKAISLVGNCAGAGYSYTPKQVAQITEVLLTAVTDTAERFTAIEKTHSTFELSG